MDRSGKCLIAVSLPSKSVGCSNASEARCGYLIRPDCRSRTRHPSTIPRFRNCATSRNGRKARPGSARSATAQVTGIMKAQIDWIPAVARFCAPTQGKTLAVMEVSGGSQSFNAVNQLRILGRWMRMITIPNQSSVAKAFQEFDTDGRMKPSSYYDRVVDVCEELVKFTILTRDASSYLTDRYSERKKKQPSWRSGFRSKSI